MRVNSVTGTYRIMAYQETGEETCIHSKVCETELEERTQAAIARYPEWRIFIEPEVNRYRSNFMSPEMMDDPMYDADRY